ncbi:helix-turn-helix transcriptional regulator [Caldanaerobius polysaccharolyticus]|uniref:helix-turn-helix transcriptional regulator n=1 Tax=Caldanaerobius polysaccharolyticus TaxID=44256 RepID=UPI00047D4D08|nr:helix-turn-helix transcriptional regulator [Caldanaerobius polysaccharolyticus]
MRQYTLRKKLKEARIQAGLTPKELAQIVGIHRASYVNIELGKRNPSLELAAKIAAVLNKSIEDIFLPIDVSNSHNEKQSEQSA